MKTRITLYALLALLIATATSCVKETSRSDAFTASFELNTPNIYSGDEFQFTITANHDRFKVTEFSFPLDPTFVTVGDTYTTDSEGRWRPHAVVPIKETCAGEISITIKDETTGSEKKFSAVYHAFKSSPVTLRIENKPLPKATTNIRDTSTPLLVSGEPLDITLKADGIERLSVKEFKCEFDNGSLPEGKDIIFDKNGEFHISFPTSFSSDKFKEETSLSLTLHDVETDRDTTLTASYLKVLPLRCEVNLSSSTITEGDDVTLSFVSNRKTIQIENISKPSWYSNYQLSNGASITLNIASGDEDVYYTGSYTSASVQVKENASGEFTLTVNDVDYTGRTLLYTLPFYASIQKDPSNIKTSKDNSYFRISEDSIDELRIWTTDDKSNNTFIVSCPSSSTGKVTFYCPKDNETTLSNISSSNFKDGPITITNNRVFFKATGTAGNTIIKITTKEEKVKKELSGYVKQSVALRIKGDFRNYMSYSPSDEVDAIFSKLAGQGIGWYGMPYSIDAELVTWENRSSKALTSLSRDEVSNYLRCYSLSTSAYNYLAPTFVVSVGNRVTSNFFYGTYRDESNPLSRLLTGIDISRVASATLPSTLNTKITEARTWGHKVTCSSLLKFLQDLDCNADYQNGYGLFVMLRETLHSDDQLGFGSFDISVQSVSYDTERYSLRYIFNLTEVPGEWGSTAPWWNRVGGTRPWIVPYNEQ